MNEQTAVINHIIEWAKTLPSRSDDHRYIAAKRLLECEQVVGNFPFDCRAYERAMDCFAKELMQGGLQ